MHIVYNAHICNYLFLGKSPNVAQPGLELEICLSPLEKVSLQACTTISGHSILIIYHITARYSNVTFTFCVAYNVGICWHALSSFFQV